MADTFDPDAFLAETAPKANAAPPEAFDPDRFLAETGGVNPPATPEGVDVLGIADATMRGVAAGATLNYADEAAGALGGAYDWAAGKLGARGEISLSDAYHTRRDVARRHDALAQEAHPVVYGASELAGGLASTVAGGAALRGAGLTLPGALAAPGVAGPALQTASGGLRAPVLVEALGTRVARGAAQGALLGGTAKAGASKEFTDMPGDFLEGAKVGGLVGGALPVVAAGAKAVGRRVLPVAARVVGGIDEKVFGKYVAGRERINAVGALPEDAVKDAVDSGVAQVLADKTATADRVAKAEQVLEQGYLAKQAELAGAATPLAKAKEMVGALAAQKSYLGSLSEQADDALLRSGASFKKDDLLSAIDKIGQGHGAAIGDEAHAALSKLQTTRDRIAEQLPDDISAQQMRDVLKQLRRDVSFDQSAGEFNDTLTGMRKDFSKRISDALKKASPEYAHYMSRMSDLAESLSTMNRHFGNEDKALGALEVLRKGGVRAQIIEDAMSKHATVNGDQSMIEHLAQMRQNQSMLARIEGGEDLRQHLFPEAWKAVQEAQAEATMAADVASPIERLTQNSTQAAIKNQGGKNVNVENRRAIEALGKATGTDYAQMISDKNVFDAFRKGNKQGSRLVNWGRALGTAAGTVVGGSGHGVEGGFTGAAIGGSIGGTIGATLDEYGPAVIKKAIDATVTTKALLASTEGVKRLGPYAVVLKREAEKGNAALVAANAYFLATDPNYGKLLSERTDIDQRREAIKRRSSGQ